MDVTDPSVTRALLDAGIDPIQMHLSDHAALAIVPTTANNLRRSRCDGLLMGRKSPPFFRLGRTVRYRADVLIEWMQEISEDKFETVAASRARQHELAGQKVVNAQ